MKISLGIVIAIILLVYWYVHDHPEVMQQAPRQSEIMMEKSV